jgi:hypothetical protein
MASLESSKALVTAGESTRHMRIARIMKEEQGGLELARRPPSVPKAVVDCLWPSKKRQRGRFELRCLAGQRDLNPKVGRDWMLPHARANKQHSLAGALNAKTRKMTWVDGIRERSALFCNFVWRLVAENPQCSLRRVGAWSCTSCRRTARRQ